MEIDVDYKMIGDRLRAVRKQRGYTQEYVAEQAEISAQHISGIECGSAKVSLPALIRLCNVLETTPDNVLMNSINHVTPQIMENVAAVFADCSPDEIYIMIAQAENIKKVLRQKRFLKG